MRGPNDFWLTYNQLIDSYKAEGATPEHRCENVLNQFRKMPASVKHHVLEDMQEFLTFLAEVHAELRSAMDGHHSQK
jgi:hypothetical protein